MVRLLRTATLVCSVYPFSIVWQRRNVKKETMTLRPRTRNTVLLLFCSCFLQHSQACERAIGKVAGVDEVVERYS